MGVFINKVTDRAFGCTACLVHNCASDCFSRIFFFSFTYLYIHLVIHCFLRSSPIGGDCVDFNARYPNCSVEYTYRIGNGYCDNHNNGGSYNTRNAALTVSLSLQFYCTDT